MIAVVQSVYGGYDILDDWIPQSVPYRRVIVDTARPHLSPRMAAKVAKCEPWRYTNADVTVWVDGSIVPTDDRFVEHLVDNAVGPLSQYVHAHRDCIQDEARVSAGMLKYAGQPVIGQAAYYMQRGHPQHWGLWATGIIVYRPSVALSLFGLGWLAEQAAWTVQDQISQPYLLHRLGMRPHTIPGDIFDMDHATIRPHESES